MPFNADTYRMNRHRKKAIAEIERARDVKTRSMRGDAYDWEIDRIPTFVKIARISWHLYLNARRHRAADRAARRVTR